MFRIFLLSRLGQNIGRKAHVPPCIVPIGTKYLVEYGWDVYCVPNGTLINGLIPIFYRYDVSNGTNDDLNRRSPIVKCTLLELNNI